MKQLTIIIIGIVIGIIVAVLSIIYSSKKDKENYGYAEYQKLTVGPNPFSGTADNGFSAADLKARVYNYRDEIITHNTLNSALLSINPGEKIAVLSIDNNKCFTRPLEDSEQVITFLAPIMDETLKTRGLKLAKNPNDDVYVYRSADAEDYNYPVGYWLYVVTEKSI